ncbi:MAG: hypothetical protein J1E96_04425 [Ruminococcus sp.]|nr:hypothetical protein [Ruminococcus sp.]
MKHIKRTAAVFLAVAVLALTLTATAFSAAANTRTVSGKFNYDYANQVLSLVNSERAKQGLNALSMDDTLVDGANIRAAECTVSFSHTRPNGTSCFTAFEWQNLCGENIAYGQRTPQEVMNGWMNSQGHRENILKQGFKKIGIGCFVAQNGTIYWTQEFSGGSVSKSYNRSGSESATVEVSLTSGSASKVDKTTPSTTEKQTSATQPTTKQNATQPTTAKKNTNTQSGSTSCKNGSCNNSLNDILSKLCPDGNCNNLSGGVLSQLCPSGNCDLGTILKNCSTNNCSKSTVKNIEPSETTVTKPCTPSLKCASNSKKCLTVKCGKVSGATKYKVCYAKNKAFSKSKVCKTISCDKKSLKISGLKSGQKYYVKVRACNSSAKSAWSPAKCVKIS